MAKVIAQIVARLPRLMEAAVCRKLRYAGGKPSLQQLKKWIEEGEIVGEVRGGCISSICKRLLPDRMTRCSGK